MLKEKKTKKNKPSPIFEKPVGDLRMNAMIHVHRLAFNVAIVVDEDLNITKLM